MKNKKWSRYDTLAERLARNVERAGECLEYRGYTDCKGYGRLMYQRRDMGAHRAAYEVAFGPIPPGLFVCHRCDNPPCVEPSHLWLGTLADNAKDAAAKGRTPRGDKNGMRLHPESVRRGSKNGASKLTEEKVREIKVLIGKKSMSEIAAVYGVSPGMIYHIKNRAKWRHVEEPAG